MKKFLPVILLLVAVTGQFISTAQPGSLWGMTAANGATNGVIFKTDSIGGNYAEVYTFNSPSQGADPYGSLVQGTDGKLYGMTSRGGTYGHGVIFSFDPQTGSYTKKHDFDSVGGKTPYGSLCRTSKGKLYGMTFRGGSAPFPGIDRGVLFEYDPATAGFAKKIDLIQKNMGNAYGSLIEGSDGKLYGLSSVGGNDATGALFNYNIPLDSLSVLESFIAGPIWEGYEPMGDLVQAGNGRYYGLSRHGGAGQAGGGVLFRYDPNGPMFDKMKALHHFSEVLPGSIDGFDLTGSLVQAGNGKLYGMTRSGGTDSAGTIFSFDTTSNSFTKVHDLDSTTEGYAPHGSLMLAGDGKLYGLITSKGEQARMFRFDPANNGFTVTTNVKGTPYYTRLIQLITPSGMPGVKNENMFVIYPNPATDKLYIDPGSKINATVQLVAADGRMVLQRTVKQNTTLDIAALPCGIYDLRIISGDKITNRNIVIHR